MALIYKFQTTIGGLSTIDREMQQLADIKIKYETASGDSTKPKSKQTDNIGVEFVPVNVSGEYAPRLPFKARIESKITTLNFLKRVGEAYIDTFQIPPKQQSIVCSTWTTDGVLGFCRSLDQNNDILNVLSKNIDLLEWFSTIVPNTEVKHYDVYER